MITIFVCILLLTSCLSSEETLTGQKTVEISLYTYYADTDKEIVDLAVQRLEQQFLVDITIIHREDATGEQLFELMESGDMPDIIELTGSSVINQLIESNRIEPIEEAMVDYGVMDKVVFSSIDPLYHPDGHIYAVNFEPVRNYLIYYNKAVFDQYGLELPKNFDEMLEVTEVFVENGIIPFALFGEEPWPGIQLFDTLATRVQPGGMKDVMLGKSSITDEAYVSAAYKIKELVDAGFIDPTAFDRNATESFELFRDGQAAMIGNGNWFLLDIATYGEGYGYLDNPLAEPGMEEATMFNRSGGSDQGGWTVNPKGDYVKLCKEVVMEYAIQRARASIELFGAANPLTDLIVPGIQRHPASQKYSDEISMFESTTYFPWSYPDPDVTESMYDYHQQLLKGLISPDEFIIKMSQVIEGN